MLDFRVSRNEKKRTLFTQTIFHRERVTDSGTYDVRRVRERKGGRKREWEKRKKIKKSKVHQEHVRKLGIINRVTGRATSVMREKIDDEF